MRIKNLKKALTFLFVVFFSSFIFYSCNQTKPLSQTDMDGYWVLKTINGVGAKTEFKGALPTLQFNSEEKTISGTGGCNRYAGAYTYDGGVFFAPELALTRMLCIEENKEGNFIQLLSDINNTLSMTNGLLTVIHDGETVLEFEKGTPLPVVALVDKAALAGTWQLKTLNGTDAATTFKGESQAIPTLSFDTNSGKISGNGGCNRYNAAFSLDEGKLIVGPIISTRMACPNLEGETKFTQAIPILVTLLFLLMEYCNSLKRELYCLN